MELAAYRIVQESLTNALKHAGPGRAEVRVEYGRRLVIDVSARSAGTAPGCRAAAAGWSGCASAR